MTVPFVSCLMPTYNRYPHHGWLVEEATESFLKQTYPVTSRELIIWNDTPRQVLNCYHPQVRVVNTERFRTLGEKRNALVGLAEGNILLVWDDDDISFPWRIQQAVDALASGNYDYWNPRHYWFWNNNKDINGKQGVQVPGNLGYGHNCSAYTRRGFEKVGGYPAVSGVEDRDMDHRFRSNKSVRIIDGLGVVPMERWSYIYRWGVSPHHLSGQANTNQHYKDLGESYKISGSYVIQPRWQRDYLSLAEEEIARIRREKGGNI